MHGLADYLNKYRNLEPPEASIRKVLCSVILSECGITLEPSSITIRNGGATISCHPAMRSELSLCVPEVLHTLRERHNVRLSFLR